MALRPSRGIVLVLCWFGLLADGYDLMAYGATLPVLIGKPPMALSVAQGGHIGSIALVGMLVGSLGAGTLTDLIGRRRLFLACVAVFSLGMIGSAVVSDVASFTATRVITCVGVGGLVPTGVAFAAEFAPPDRRSRLVGAVLTGPPIGMLLAACTASVLAPVVGFRPVYGLAGIFLLLIPVLLWALPESPTFLAVCGEPERAQRIRERFGIGAAEEAAQGRSPLASIMAPKALPGTVLIWGSTLCSLLTLFGVTTWLPQVMSSAGYGLGSAIRFLAIYCAGAVISTLVAARIADVIGPKWPAVVGFVCAAGALLVISGRPGTPMLVVLVLLAGFGGIGTQNVLNDFIARHYPPHARASGLGWALGIGRIGAIAGPTFGAWAVAGSAPLQATALSFGSAALIGAALMALTPRRSRVFDDPGTVRSESAAAREE